MDNLTKEQRRKNMQNIRSADTKVEIKIRSVLHRKGYRFHKNYKKLIGKPDIVLPKYKTVIFIDSCFWHKCPLHYKQPKTNLRYWKPKIERNVTRAQEVNKILKKNGWKVIRIWEHSIKKSFDKYILKIEKELIKQLKQKAR